jgi:phosphoglycolate phosphatase
MTYDTVIFDLDGTLLDTLEDLKDSCNYALAQVGAPARTLEEVRQFVGNGIGRLIELALPGGKENPDFDKALAIMQEYYKTHNQIKTAPYPGVLDMLVQIKELGLSMAVVTNKPDSSAKPLVEEYFLGMIPVAIGEREGVRRKPAPDTVEEALRILGKEKRTAVYVGDSEVDLATARNSGLDCISVTWGFRDRAMLEREGAAMYAETPEDVLKLL